MTILTRQCILTFFYLYFIWISLFYWKIDSSNKKKLCGHPQSKVWKHYEKKPLKSAGHFSAKCNYCKKFWARGHPNELESHLANNCRESPEFVRSFYLDFIISQDFGEEEDTAVLLSENKKKRKVQAE